MKAQKPGRVFAATALMTVLAIGGMTTASQAAASSVPQPKMTLPQPTAVVEIGTAMLEEYHGGNPAARTEIFRGGSAAQVTPGQATDTGKHRS